MLPIGQSHAGPAVDPRAELQSHSCELQYDYIARVTCQICYSSVTAPKWLHEYSIRNGTSAKALLRGSGGQFFRPIALFMQEGMTFGKPRRCVLSTYSYRRVMGAGSDDE